METVVCWIKDRKLIWAVLAVFYASLFGIGFLYRFAMGKLGYIAVFSGVFMFLFLAADHIRYRAKRKEIKRLLNAGVWHRGMFETSPGEYEKLYREMTEQMREEMFRILDDGEMKLKNMMDYYALWAHQIKTPIAAMRIVIQAGRENCQDQMEKETYDSLSMELFKIEQYVEMVLSYLKAEDIAKDMVLKEYTVEGMVKQAVRKYSRLFILQKLPLKLSEIQGAVITDEKWLVFVLEQLLSNALKYTKSGCVSIYMTDRYELVIEDTGIGISAEDLPRVMEKGFTGYNGREDKKSTGIGLYLCRTILDKLGHSIRIESEEGKGTKVFLDLNRDKVQAE